MTGHDCKRLRNASIGQWYARNSWYGNRRTDAWNEFDVNASLHGQRPLLRTTTEDDRVAAFEATDHSAGYCVGADEIEDLTLGPFLLAFVLADVYKLGIASAVREYLGANEPVVQDNIALVQNTGRFQREQLRVTRSGTDQIQLSRFRPFAH